MTEDEGSIGTFNQAFDDMAVAAMAAVQAMIAEPSLYTHYQMESAVLNANNLRWLGYDLPGCGIAMTDNGPRIFTTENDDDNSQGGSLVPQVF